MLAVADRLGISVDGPKGPLGRWADDEPDAERIPDDLQISKSLPGGDKALRCSLLGDPLLDRPDTHQLNEIRAYGPGNETVWRGFLSSDSEGTDRRNPAAVGDAARFQDDPAIPFRIIDRDLSRFSGPSRARKLALLTANYAVYEPSVRQDESSGRACIEIDLDGAWASPRLPIGEAWYDAGPVSRVVAVNFKLSGGPSYDSAFAFYTVFSATDYGADVASGDLWAGSPIASTSQGPSDGVPRRFCFFESAFGSTPGGADGRSHDVAIEAVGVHFDHGLTPRDLPGPGTYWGGDVVRYLLDRHRVSGGPIGYTADSIDSGSEFGIPHLAEEEPVNVEAGLESVGRFYEHEWAVCDRTAFWLPRKSFGRLWYVRRDEGARAEGAGYSEDHLFNGTLVTYTDPSGASRTVGPPGSGLDPFAGSNAGLLVTDEENVLNQWRRRRWARLAAPMTTEAGAIRLGERFTQAIQTRQLSGSLTVENGMLMDSAGARYPAWAVSPGDRIVVLGSGDTTERFIVATDYTRSDRKCRLTLDSAPEDLASTLERLQVVLVGAVV